MDGSSAQIEIRPMAGALGADIVSSARCMSIW
jgi:hypothetical protein